MTCLTTKECGRWNAEDNEKKSKILRTCCYVVVSHCKVYPNKMACRSRKWKVRVNNFGWVKQISDYMALGRDIYDFSVFVLINRVSCLGLYYQRHTVPNPPPPPLSSVPSLQHFCLKPNTFLSVQVLLWVSQAQMCPNRRLIWFCWMTILPPLLLGLKKVG